MARTLASEPDVLLLDEPTNHLDIVSIRWLETFLLRSRGVVVIVSHDHRFLDNVCTHIVDVDYERLTLYRGSYEDFKRQKAEERERKEREITQREKEIAHHKAMIDRFRAKPTKARQAQSKAKLVERTVVESLPRSSRRPPRFELAPRRPSGRRVLEARGLAKAFGDNVVLDGVSLSLQRGDRMAVIGPNGVGKSTLVKLLLGRLSPDAGEVEWGHEAHRGYFAQDHAELLAEVRDRTVEAVLADACPGESVGFVRAKLANVLFDKDEIGKRVGALSGGESSRLLFALLSVQRPNVVLLDEPTNHLDLEGVEALAETLRRYEGSIVLVSHDRWFVSQVATRILELRPDGLDDFRGTYEEFLRQSGDDHLDAAASFRRERGRERRRRA
jgi:ATPase subunit of ABC transporter with duplicated ATPase domains